MVPRVFAALLIVGFAAVATGVLTTPWIALAGVAMVVIAVTRCDG